MGVGVGVGVYMFQHLVLCSGSCLAKGVVLQLFVQTYHRLLSAFGTSITNAYSTHFFKSSGLNAKAKFHFRMYSFPYVRVVVSVLYPHGLVLRAGLLHVVGHGCGTVCPDICCCAVCVSLCVCMCVCMCVCLCPDICCCAVRLQA